jgi:biopolymer transport protein ExbD
VAISIRKGRALDALNLTPLIDVVFLLLIFFLVATRFSEEDRELPIRLPSASNALPMTVEPDELVIHIDAEGVYNVNGKTVGYDGLERIVGQAVADNPLHQIVVIRADKSVALQAAVTVMDLCTKLKVPSYKISTEPKEGS